MFAAYYINHTTRTIEHVEVKSKMAAKKIPIVKLHGLMEILIKDLNHGLMSLPKKTISGQALSIEDAIFASLIDSAQKMEYKVDHKVIQVSLPKLGETENSILKIFD